MNMLVAVAVLGFIFLLFSPRFSWVEGHTLHVRTCLLTFRYDLRKAVAMERVPPDFVSRWKTMRVFGAGTPMKPFGWFYSRGTGMFLNLVNDPSQMCLISFPGKRLLASPVGGLQDLLDARG